MGLQPSAAEPSLTKPHSLGLSSPHWAASGITGRALTQKTQQIHVGSVHQNDGIDACDSATRRLSLDCTVMLKGGLGAALWMLFMFDPESVAQALRSK